MALVANRMEDSTVRPVSRSVAVKLYARMGPFLFCLGGRSHVTRTCVEVSDVAVMLSGGPEGATFV